MTPRTDRLADAAKTAMTKGKYKKAVKRYLALEDSEPDNGAWPQGAAEAYRRLGQDADAIAAYTRAMHSFTRADDNDRASQVCTAILRIAPTDRAARDWLAKRSAARGSERLPDTSLLAAGSTSGLPLESAPPPRGPTPAAPPRTAHRNVCLSEASLSWLRSSQPSPPRKR